MKSVAKRDGFRMVWRTGLFCQKIKPKKGTVLQTFGARCSQRRVKALDSRLFFACMIAYDLMGFRDGFQSLKRQGLQLVKARVSGSMLPKNPSKVPASIGSAC